MPGSPAIGPSDSLMVRQQARFRAQHRSFSWRAREEGTIAMNGTRALATLLAIGLQTSTNLGATWYAQDAYAASRNPGNERAKVLADCNHQANQRRIGATSIRKKNFVRDCMRQRGFSGPP